MALQFKSVLEVEDIMNKKQNKRCNYKNIPVRIYIIVSPII